MVKNRVYAKIHTCENKVYHSSPFFLAKLKIGEDVRTGTRESWDTAKKEYENLLGKPLSFLQCEYKLLFFMVPI